MTYSIDPEHSETRVIYRLVDWAGLDVLEVGCGNGRVTRRYADEANSVLAVDMNPERIREAEQNSPEHLRAKVSFRVGDVNEMALAGDSYDAVILSNSL